MGCIFILLGKTYSYKEYIKRHIENNPELNCTDISKIDESRINIVSGNISDLTNILCRYDVCTYPVYIDTPSDQILRDGIEAARLGKDTYEDLCRRFIAECKEYSDDVLKGIKAEIIQDRFVSDSCRSFMNYVVIVASKL